MHGATIKTIYYSCQILIKLKIFDRFSKKKFSETKFYEIRTVGAELFHTDGWTDRRGKADGRLSQFCECA